MKRHLGSVAPFVLLWPCTAIAQTTIVADENNPFDVGTTVSTTAEVTTISDGTRAGNNLFHSFAQFDLAQGDIAQWVRNSPDATTIENVVNRVTGGDASQINGTMRMTDMSNARFFFVNPSGILFGEGAAIDVPGAAHFSTAETLLHKDATSFSAILPNSSTLSSAPLSAFGFLGAQADIALAVSDQNAFARADMVSFSAANLSMNGEYLVNTLSLAAMGNSSVVLDLAGMRAIPTSGNITLGSPGVISRIFTRAADFLAANVVMENLVLEIPAGDTASLANSIRSQSLILNDTLIRFNNIGGEDAGSVEISGQDISLSESAIISNITSSGNGADLLLEASNLSLADSTISSLAGRFAGQIDGSTVTGRLGSLSIEADQISLVRSEVSHSAEVSSAATGQVSIRASQDLLLDGSIVFHDSANNDHSGNAIELAAPLVRIANSRIRAASNFGSEGAGRGIGISGDIIAIFDESQIETSTRFSAVDAGPIDISASGGLFVVGARIQSETVSGEGNGGVITVSSPEIVLADSDVISASDSGGDAGSIIVSGIAGQILGTSTLSAATFGSGGDAGSVSLDFSETLLTGGQVLISSNTFGDGNAGSVAIHARLLDLAPGTLIDSGTASSGSGGSISLSGEELVGNAAIIATSTRNQARGGRAGDVVVDFGRITLNDTFVTSLSRGSGDAGNIDIRSDTLALRDSLIASDTDGVTDFITGEIGDGGAATISSRVVELDNSIIGTGTFGAGQAGNLLVYDKNAADFRSESISLSNGSLVTADTFGVGGAGSIVLIGHTINLEGSRIESDTISAGKGGLINVEAGRLSLSRGASVQTEAVGLFASGDAGNILIEAAQIDLSGGSRISSDAISALDANAGNIALRSDHLLIDGGIISSTTLGDGNAGSVLIRGRFGDGEVSVANVGVIATGTAGAGDAGLIEIDVARLSLLGGSVIASQAELGSGGAAGTVTIVAAEVRLSDQALVSSATAGSGNAGSIGLAVGDLVVEDSAITTSTLFAGDAGRVLIDAGSLTILDGSTVTSQTSLGSSGAAGTVAIGADTMVVAGRSVVSSATAGSGDAGAVELSIGELIVEGSSITSSTIRSGNAGRLSIVADKVEMLPGSFILSSAAPDSSGDAGDLALNIGQLRATGGSIQARSLGLGEAGSIGIIADEIALLEGSEITTNSEFGPAGTITLTLPADGLLRLSGEDLQSVIATSSGTNTGGQITISEPFLILSDGGRILALGEVSGANVQIASDFFVQSADNVNVIAVDGDVVLDSQFADLSRGTETTTVDFLDASSVLNSQCAAVRQSGQTSVFSSLVTGPYTRLFPSGAHDQSKADQEGVRPKTAGPVAMMLCD
ncbi:MAG: filamentous hemagglutinin N-terminal domain-containing protein [Erythrobacter sp.]|nr:filamentous hemagglutinin N-terminal domain-containing protein [Erythrobacter sp.]